MIPTRIALFVLVLAAAVLAQTTPQTSPPAAQLPALNAGYGRAHHPTSSKNAQAQQYFDQGMALYYGFNHEEAERCFAAAAQLDPRLAMAHWGIALAVGPNYNL